MYLFVLLFVGIICSAFGQVLYYPNITSVNSTAPFPAPASLSSPVYGFHGSILTLTFSTPILQPASGFKFNFTNQINESVHSFYILGHNANTSQNGWIRFVAYMNTKGTENEYLVSINPVNCTQCIFKFVGLIPVAKQVLGGCEVGVPGIAPTECYHGSIVSLMVFNFYEFSSVGNFPTGIAAKFVGSPTPLPICRNMTHGTCNTSTGVSTCVWCQLQTNVTGDYLLSLTLTMPLTNISANASVPLELTQPNMRMGAFVPTITSITGCKIGAILGVQPRAICGHMQRLTITGFGFYPNATVALLSGGFGASPRCGEISNLTSTYFVCVLHVDQTTVSGWWQMTVNVNVGGVISKSNDVMYAFLEPPTVTSITGCNNNGASASGCYGGHLITFNGAWLASSSLYNQNISFVSPFGASNAGEPPYCQEVPSSTDLSVSCRLHVGQIEYGEKWLLVMYVGGVLANGTITILPVPNADDFNHTIAYAGGGSAFDGTATRVFRVGGVGSVNNMTAAVYSYDVLNNTRGWVPRANLPQPRCDMAVASTTDPSATTASSTDPRILYTFGGGAPSSVANQPCDGTQPSSRDIFRYDAVANTWSTAAARIPSIENDQSLSLPQDTGASLFQVSMTMTDFTVSQDVTLSHLSLYTNYVSYYFRIFLKEGSHVGSESILSDWLDITPGNQLALHLNGATHLTTSKPLTISLSSSLSVAAWIYLPLDGTFDGGVVFGCDTGVTTDWAMNFQINAARQPEIFMRTTGSGQYSTYTVRAQAPLTPGDWHYVVWTRDAPNRILIAVDGVTVSSSCITYTPAATLSEPCPFGDTTPGFTGYFRIGADFTSGTSSYFEGFIDELVIGDPSLMNLQTLLPIDPTTAMYYWRFNDGADAKMQALDLGIHQNHLEVSTGTLLWADSGFKALSAVMKPYTVNAIPTPLNHKLTSQGAHDGKYALCVLASQPHMQLQTPRTTPVADDAITFQTNTLGILSGPFTTTALTASVGLLGAVNYSRNVESCFVMAANGIAQAVTNGGTITLSKATSMPFSRIRSVQLFVQLSGATISTTDVSITVTSPGGSGVTAQNILTNAKTATWADGGWVGFEDGASNGFVNATMFPSAEYHKLEAPTWAPVTSFAAMFPDSAPGTWSIAFHSNLALNGATTHFTVTAFELRVCQEQGGVAGSAAASTTTGSILLTGGYTSGIHVYNHDLNKATDASTQTTLNALATPASASVYDNLNVDGFAAIQSIRLGLFLPTAPSNVDVRLTAPPRSIGEQSGQWFADGTTSDASGNNLNLILTSSAGYTFERDSACKLYGHPAFRFTAAQTSALIQFPVLVPPPTPAFTIALWVKNSSPSAALLMGWGPTEQGVYLDATGHVEWREFWNASVTPIVSTSALTAGTWSHVAVTRGTDRRITIYINGLVVGHGLSNLTSVNQDTTYLGYGLRNSVAAPFVGSMFDVRLIRRALSASELTALVSDGCGGVVLDIATGKTTIATAMTKPQHFADNGDPIVNATTYPNNVVGTYHPFRIGSTGGFAQIQSASAGRWTLSLTWVAGTLPLDSWSLEINGTQSAMAKTVLQYRPDAATLTKLNQLNTGRHGHVSAVAGTKLFVLGGLNSLNRYENVLASTEWMELNDLNDLVSPATPRWTAGPPMLTPRYRPAVASWGRFIIVAGGMSTNGVVLNTAERLDTSTMTWEPITLPLGYPVLGFERYGAFFSASNGRLMVGGGIASQQERLWTVDYVDIQRSEPTFHRMANVDLHADCVSRAVAYSAGQEYRGVLALGNKSSEADCGAACATLSQCEGYTYYSLLHPNGTVRGMCFGRTMAGRHRCAQKLAAPAELGNVLSAIKSEPNQVKALALRSGGLTNAGGGTNIELELFAKQNCTLTGITLDIRSVATNHLVQFYVRPGGHLSAMPYGLVAAVNFANMAPGYQTFSVNIPLLAGMRYTLWVNAPSQTSYAYHNAPASSTDAEDDFLLIIPSSTVAVFPVFDGSLHYRAAVPHSVWPKCYDSLAWSPTAINVINHPDFHTDGFSLFARVMVTNATTETVIWHKARPNSTDTLAEGGFVVAVRGGALSIRAITGAWKVIPTVISSNVWFNLLVTYNVEGMWRIVLDDVQHTLLELIPQEMPLHPLVIGGTGDTSSPFQGVMKYVSIDCGDTGPAYDPTSFYPYSGTYGILTGAQNFLSIRFTSPIVANEGAIRLTTSLYGGLSDRTMVTRKAVNITDAIISGNEILYHVQNFSSGVRYDVTLDVGAVRSANDYSPFLGLLYVGAGRCEWQFEVSYDYYPTQPACAGKPCATCSACRFVQNRPDNSKEYMCTIPMDGGRMKYVQRINVETKPTSVCP